MSLFFIRAFRAAKLDASVFDEVMADTKTMTQAIIVVFLYAAAVAYGIFGRAGVAGVNSAIVITLVGWYLWAFSIYFAGVRLFPETRTTADRKAFMRAMGFASSPGWLCLLGLFPGLGAAVFVGASVWMIVASVIAVKKALNYTSTYRAAVLTVVCWIPSFLFQGLMVIIILSAFGVPESQF
mgnify:FL=1|jgi:hypothetical protein